MRKQDILLFFFKSFSKPPIQNVVLIAEVFLNKTPGFMFPRTAYIGQFKT
jgi:hypothetical protein